MEDLEPHRFEDLVRQLLYDFRPWASIEATGRGGSDDGYDARAWERIDTQEERELDGDDEVTSATRLWLVQCKREKAISPKKLAGYLKGLPQNDEEQPPGTLLVSYEQREMPGSEKTCPRCAEKIKLDALVCRFCGHY